MAHENPNTTRLMQACSSDYAPPAFLCHANTLTVPCQASTDTESSLLSFAGGALNFGPNRPWGIGALVVSDPPLYLGSLAVDKRNKTRQRLGPFDARDSLPTGASAPIRVGSDLVLFPGRIRDRVYNGMNSPANKKPGVYSAANFGKF